MGRKSEPKFKGGTGRGIHLFNSFVHTRGVVPDAPGPDRGEVPRLEGGRSWVATTLLSFPWEKRTRTQRLGKGVGPVPDPIACVVPPSGVRVGSVGGTSGLSGPIQKTLWSHSP